MTTTYPPFTKSFPMTKVSEATHETYGRVTAEIEDADGEICDFEAQKPYYKQWAESQLAATTAAGIGPSMGNIRWQHTLEIAGKVTAINFADEKKEVWLKTQPIPEKWPLIRDGFVTGLSQAGTYVRRWCTNCGTDIARGNNCPRCAKTVPVRYCAKLSEVSYVDRPAVPVAVFQYVKANGQTEMRKFVTLVRPAPPAGWAWWDTDVWDDSPAILVPTAAIDDSHGFEEFSPDEGIALASVPPAATTYILSPEYSSDDTGFE